jgi:hypothetical protein
MMDFWGMVYEVNRVSAQVNTAQAAMNSIVKSPHPASDSRVATALARPPPAAAFRPAGRCNRRSSLPTAEPVFRLSALAVKAHPTSRKSTAPKDEIECVKERCMSLPRGKDQVKQATNTAQEAIDSVACCVSAIVGRHSAKRLIHVNEDKLIHMN